MSTATPFLFLDLDGTVRKGYDELCHFVNTVEDVHVFPEAIAKMRAWKGKIVGISNQGGVGLGHVSAETMSDIMSETQRQAQTLFDFIYYCTHAPTEGCRCRKPKTYFVQAAIRASQVLINPAESLFVGDRDEDKQCAENAHLPFMWASEWRK